MKHKNFRLSAFSAVSELPLIDGPHKLKEWVNNLNKIFLYFFPLRRTFHKGMYGFFSLQFIWSFQSFLCVGGTEICIPEVHTFFSLEMCSSSYTNVSTWNLSCFIWREAKAVTLHPPQAGNLALCVFWRKFKKGSPASQSFPWSKLQINT